MSDEINGYVWLEFRDDRRFVDCWVVKCISLEDLHETDIEVWVAEDSSESIRPNVSTYEVGCHGEERVNPQEYTCGEYCNAEDRENSETVEDYQRSIRFVGCYLLADRLLLLVITVLVHTRLNGHRLQVSTALHSNHRLRFFLFFICLRIFVIVLIVVRFIAKPRGLAQEDVKVLLRWRKSSCRIIHRLLWTNRRKKKIPSIAIAIRVYSDATPFHVKSWRHTYCFCLEPEGFENPLNTRRLKAFRAAK